MATPSITSSENQPGRDRRGAALAVLALAQLMVVLDATIVAFAAVAIAGAHAVLREPAARTRPRLDAASVITVSAGLFALVYGAAAPPGRNGRPGRRKGHRCH
ncbi:MAG: hypothetical protein ACRDOI_21075 [Trebonia sp.]